MSVYTCQVVLLPSALCVRVHIFHDRLCNQLFDHIFANNLFQLSCQFFSQFLTSLLLPVQQRKPFLVQLNLLTVLLELLLKLE
jgi:hypothetical protein